MRGLSALLCAGGLWAAGALAQSPVTLTVGAGAGGPVIPDDFVGLSFGMKALPGDSAGAHLFSATNTPLVTLFRNVGLRHLRVGGTTVESPPSTPIPNETDIDSLFGFARAAGVKKIIYSFRLLETNAACHYSATNAALAKYIWDHHRAGLDCFAIGNEPDLQRVFKQDYEIRDFESYIKKWKKFAAAIVAVVPEAKFTGADAGSGNAGWSGKFSHAVKDSGLVTSIAEHYYAGGKGRDVPAADGLATMLSAEWLKKYEALHRKIEAMVAADGMPYRFTEANDHYSGGIPGASDTLAGALWALDFLHWWAAHGAQGVDFHNTQWVVSDIVTPALDGRFRVNPKAYGLKAFDLGSHGAVEALKISDPDNINLTAYAVRGAREIFVTVINKEYGPQARAADVTLAGPGFGHDASAIVLAGAAGEAAAKTGVTLGGGTITDDAPWSGKWTQIKPGARDQYKIKVAATSAAVVKIAVE